MNDDDEREVVLMDATTAAVLVGAYLIGAVPFGYILVRVSRGFDIRTRGSGNIGATNVQRYLGNSAGALTLLLDAGKGGVAVWVAAGLGLDRYWVAAAAVLAVVGHSYPVFLGFRGGKGVATGAGAFAVLTPWGALGALAVFSALAATSRFVSLGSVGAALSFPLFAGLWYGRPEFGAALLVSLLVLFRHRENIGNLLSKRERRLGREMNETDSGADAGD